MLTGVEREPLCDLCEDTGTITWQQPAPGPCGALELTEMNHPCVNGCSGWFKIPAAERGNVISAGAVDIAPGNVAVSNTNHRTEWFRPVPPSDGLVRRAAGQIE